MEQNETSLIDQAYQFYDEEDYEQARILFEQALEEGDERAACQLGILYYYGYGVEQDYKRAVKYYKIGEKIGDVACLHNLGKCYYFGKGVEVDFELSAFYMEKAAKKGNIDAMYSTGINYLYGYGVSHDIVKSLYWLRLAAEDGNVDAIVTLGTLYDNGAYVKKDKEKALGYYEKASEADDPHAKLLLAPYYEKGHIVKKNLKKAAKLYQEAYDYYYEKAVKGDEEAQFRLGNIYCFDGIPLIGIPQSDVEATRWFEKAALQGHSAAQVHFGHCYAYGMGVEQNKEKAFYWYQLAANRNNVFGLYSLAGAYLDGEGVETDKAKAAELFRKAANQGYSYAQVMLGKCYLEGMGVTQNYIYAVEWLQKACEEEERDAFALLGDCYLKGFGVEQNEKKAIELYRKGATMGDLEAKVKLAEAYLSMMGTSKYHLREAKEILSEVCQAEEYYRKKRIPFIKYSDIKQRTYITDPLNSWSLARYGKAFFMLGILKDTVRGKRTNEVIRLLRTAEQLGYTGEDDSDDSPAARLERIIRETNRKYIKDTVESRVEIRESTKKIKGKELYDIYILHADGSETKIEFQGRNKLFYILCLMAAHEAPRVAGIKTSHFPYLKKELIELVETMNLSMYKESDLGRWIDSFTFLNDEAGYIAKQNIEVWTWETRCYSQASTNTKKDIKKACISEEEMEVFTPKSPTRKGDITTLALSPDQIIIPESLQWFLNVMPTQEEIDRYICPGERRYQFQRIINE